MYIGYIYIYTYICIYIIIYKKIVVCVMYVNQYTGTKNNLKKNLPLIGLFNIHVYNDCPLEYWIGTLPCPVLGVGMEILTKPHYFY